MAFIEPLDLRTLFVNTLAGSPNIFLILSVIIMSIGAGYFRMPSFAFLILLGLWMLMLETVLHTGVFTLMTLIIIGLVIFTLVPKIVKN